MSKLSKRRGSALVVVLIFAMALTMIIASTLRYSLTERKLNYREAMRLEARNAAEAISEYGLSQIRQKMSTRSDFTPTRFTTGTDANSITMPPTSFWSGGSVVTTAGTTTSPELVVGLLSPVTNGSSGSSNTLYYYDPADPSNEFDPLKGRYAFRFDLRIIAKATVNPPSPAAGAQQTIYMSQTLSARAAPLFSHAIFYNMDLELWPGPAMNILGGVHTNGNLYVKKQSSTGLAINFVGPVTVAGGGHPALTSSGTPWAAGFYSGVKCNILNTNGTSDDLSGYTDNTFFSTSAGGLVGIKDTSVTPNRWRDQKWGALTETTTTQESFRIWSTQTYGGNLQTKLHGVQVSNLTGVGDYLEDATPTDGVDDSINESRQLIQPPLRSTDTGYSAEVESQKYAPRSGIYIAANPTDLYLVARTPTGSTFLLPPQQYRAFTINGTQLLLPGQATYTNFLLGGATGLNLARPVLNPTDTTKPIIKIRPNEMYDMRRGRRADGTKFIWTSSRSATNNYEPLNIDLIDVDMRELKLAVDKSVNGLTQSSAYTTVFPGDVATTAAAWTNFIYNPSATPNATTALTDQNKILIQNPLIPATFSDWNGAEWNGAIYIQSVEAENRSTGTYTSVNPLTGLVDGTYTAYSSAGRDRVSGVRLINGRGRVASKSNGQGLTIATNDALYVLGHYNADGTIDSSSTGTTNSGRYPETDETPCSLAGDSLTILSMPGYTNSGSGSNRISQTMGWNDARSILRNDDANWISGWKTSAASNSNRIDGTDNGAATVYGWKLPYDNTSSTLPAGPSAYATTKLPGNNTEISAAFLVGIVISNKDGNGQNSGGANNYPRFNEDFSASGTQSTVAIRGSIVAMFESRVAVEPWNWRTFNAPARLWGFSELFNTGRFPPLTPVTMFYRRIDFNDIPKTTYDTLKAAWR